MFRIEVALDTSMAFAFLERTGVLAKDFPKLIAKNNIKNAGTTRLSFIFALRGNHCLDRLSSSRSAAYLSNGGLGSFNQKRCGDRPEMLDTPRSLAIMFSASRVAVRREKNIHGQQKEASRGTTVSASAASCHGI
jgi:hypothetical protein